MLLCACIAPSPILLGKLFNWGGLMDAKQAIFHLHSRQDVCNTCAIFIAVAVSDLKAVFRCSELSIYVSSLDPYIPRGIRTPISWRPRRKNPSTNSNFVFTCIDIPWRMLECWEKDSTLSIDNPSMEQQSVDQTSPVILPPNAMKLLEQSSCFQFGAK